MRKHAGTRVCAMWGDGQRHAWPWAPAPTSGLRRTWRSRNNDTVRLAGSCCIRGSRCSTQQRGCMPYGSEGDLAQGTVVTHAWVVALAHSAPCGKVLSCTGCCLLLLLLLTCRSGWVTCGRTVRSCSPAGWCWCHWASLPHDTGGCAQPYTEGKRCGASVTGPGRSGRHLGP